MDYNLFRKSVAGKNGKQVKRWYYWFYDEHGQQIKKACKKCSTKSEAEDFITALPSLEVINKQKTIAQIADTMFIPASWRYNCMESPKNQIKRFVY